MGRPALRGKPHTFPCRPNGRHGPARTRRNRHVRYPQNVGMGPLGRAGGGNGRPGRCNLAAAQRPAEVVGLPCRPRGRHPQAGRANQRPEHHLQDDGARLRHRVGHDPDGSFEFPEWNEGSRQAPLPGSRHVRSDHAGDAGGGPRHPQDDPQAVLQGRQGQGRRNRQDGDGQRDQGHHGERQRCAAGRPRAGRVDPVRAGRLGLRQAACRNPEVLGHPRHRTGPARRRTGRPRRCDASACRADQGRGHRLADHGA